MLWHGRSRVRLPVRARDFSVFQDVQTGFGANPSSCSLGTGVLSLVCRGVGIKVARI